MPSNDAVPATDVPAVNDTTDELGDDALEAVVGGQPPVTGSATFGVAAAPPLVIADSTRTQT